MGSVVSQGGLSLLGLSLLAALLGVKAKTVVYDVVGKEKVDEGHKSAGWRDSKASALAAKVLKALMEASVKNKNVNVTVKRYELGWPAEYELRVSGDGDIAVALRSLSTELSLAPAKNKEAPAPDNSNKDSTASKGNKNAKDNSRAKSKNSNDKDSKSQEEE